MHFICTAFRFYVRVDTSVEDNFTNSQMRLFHPEFSNGIFKKVRKSFIYQFNSRLLKCRWARISFKYVFSFLVKAKVYSAKCQQAIAKIPSLKFWFFFHEILFPKTTYILSYWEVASQFLMNKMVCIPNIGKVW